MSQRFFNFSVQCVATSLILRDLALGRLKPGWGIDPADTGVSRHIIHGSGKPVDAIFVTPPSGPPRASLLICHGIGETVQGWYRVQKLLAGHGIASLVF